MDFGKLPFDLQAAVIRFADSADRQAYATYADLDASLPERDYALSELEAILEYLASRGVTLIDAD
jgi:hypothetical protein